MIRENELRLLYLQRKMLTITKDNTDTQNGISKVLQGVHQVLYAFKLIKILFGHDNTD